MSLQQQINDILESFGTELVEDLQKSLQAKHGKKGNEGGSATRLAGSIDFNIAVKGTSFEFNLTMDEYWKWLENGRKKGKMPPTAPLIEWLKSQNINALAIYKNKLKTGKTKIKYAQAAKSLAFGISKMIAKKGTIKRYGYKGSKFLSSVIFDGRLYKLEEQLTLIVGKEIEITLKNLLDGNNIPPGTE